MTVLQGKLGVEFNFKKTTKKTPDVVTVRDPLLVSELHRYLNNTAEQRQTQAAVLTNQSSVSVTNLLTVCLRHM